MRKPGRALVKSIWARCLACIGRRGLVLLTLAVQFGIYGAALMTSSTDAAWWPVHEEQYLLGVAVPTWGMAWLGVAAFTLLGVPLKHDRAQFAVAAGMTGLWAFTAAHTHYWGPSAIYAGLTLLILLCSGWPDIRQSPP